MGFDFILIGDERLNLGDYMHGLLTNFDEAFLVTNDEFYLYLSILKFSLGTDEEDTSSTLGSTNSILINFFKLDYRSGRNYDL